MTGQRYLITYSDGGSGMRHHEKPFEVGDELEDCGNRYRVVNVEPPRSDAGFGRAWAERDTAERVSIA